MIQTDTHLFRFRLEIPLFPGISGNPGSQFGKLIPIMVGLNGRQLRIGLQSKQKCLQQTDGAVMFAPPLNKRDQMRHSFLELLRMAKTEKRHLRIDAEKLLFPVLRRFRSVKTDPVMVARLHARGRIFVIVFGRGQKRSRPFSPDLFSMVNGQSNLSRINKLEPVVKRIIFLAVSGPELNIRHRKINSLVILH